MENEGQLPKIHVEGSHEPIISLEDFAAVQEEIRLRAEANGYRGKRKATVYPFSGMIVCAQCGRNYRRKAMRDNTVWICPTFNQKGKAACSSKQIPEGILTGVAMETVGDVAGLREKVSCIRAENGNRLVITTADGSEIVKRWQDRSRSESWTPKMKEAARQKALARSKA